MAIQSREVAALERKFAEQRQERQEQKDAQGRLGKNATAEAQSKSRIESVDLDSQPVVGTLYSADNARDYLFDSESAERSAVQTATPWKWWYVFKLHRMPKQDAWTDYYRTKAG
jgi:hypothetical protein